MFQSLLKHQSTLEQAVQTAEFDRLAKSSRSGLDSKKAELEVDSQINDLADLLEGLPPRIQPDMPPGVASNNKYSTVFLSVLDNRFWRAVAQYIRLNEPVAEAISILSGDSVCLSDATLLVMRAGRTVHDVTLATFKDLFESSHQIAELQRLWDKRADHLTGLAHLSLLLDPRADHRNFVSNEPLIMGSEQDRNWGNTAFIRSADQSLRSMADVVLSDSHKIVVERAKVSRQLSLVKVKEALLSGALKAYLGVHASKSRKHLHITEDMLAQYGVGGEPPVAFWEQTVPPECLLREVGIRAMSAKPSSAAVERLWNAFGDNLTSKRRSLKNTTLAEVVYVKMNIRLIPNGVDMLEGEYGASGFDDVLDFIDAIEEEELVKGLESDEQMEEAVQGGAVELEDAESDGVADW